MPPAKSNGKKESGRAKKAENEAKKKEVVAAAKEKKEADEWASGAKSNKSKEEKEEKKRAEAARKAENARLLAEEEAAVAAKPKAAPKAGAKKKDVKPAGPGAMAAGGLATGASGTSTPKSPPKSEFEVIPPESFSATGIDDALELLSIVGAKTDKASVGQAAAGIEQHPERRYKAAFEAYQERELPKLKVEHPGLRLNQYKELLHKKFLKSPDNPFNQTTVSYDASKQEKVAALKQKHALVEERLRDQ